MQPNERWSSKSDDRNAETNNLINYRRLLAMANGGGTTNSEPPVTSSTHQQLCCLFMHRVDPICKILHRPSLKAFLVDGSPYLDYEPGHLAPTALAYSVYYAASCSLSDEESMHSFGIPKSTMVSRYQKDAEAALARADFITTNDLTVLQAYVLFLVRTSTHPTPFNRSPLTLPSQDRTALSRPKPSNVDDAQHGPSHRTSPLAPSPGPSLPRPTL